MKRLGREGSAIGFGAWQIGADWGEVDENEALETLRAAADAGVTFFDTADVYGDGRSERLVGRLKAERPEIFVAAKMGRRLEQTVENYPPEHFRAWNDRSRENLGVDTLELVQLHCPPIDPLLPNKATIAVCHAIRTALVHKAPQSAAHG